MDITQIKKDVETLLPKAVEALGVLLDSEEVKASDIKLTFDLAKMLGVSLTEGLEGVSKAPKDSLSLLSGYKRTAQG